MIESLVGSLWVLRGDVELEGGCSLLMQGPDFEACAVVWRRVLHEAVTLAGLRQWSTFTDRLNADCGLGAGNKARVRKVQRESDSIGARAIYFQAPERGLLEGGGLQLFSTAVTHGILAVCTQAVSRRTGDASGAKSVIFGAFHCTKASSSSQSQPSSTTSKTRVAWEEKGTARDTGQLTRVRPGHVCQSLGRLS